ncbi:hypothetical protein CU097_014891 [Rhizopus azygosporus]|uniref:Uncharacterized protein n=1 Tax=Rhizopus azygosporus TaxID=86630 RepID=A0A367K5B5_RHIAZ|nr:hypothetical protein CU097_014891 [Rhizopus azygosporus]
MSEFTEESFNAFRQQLAETQAIVQQLVQERQTSPSETDSSLHFPLHAFGVRPHYDWIPDLFIALMLSEADCTSIIDNYLHIRSLSYVPPNILPESRGRMNRSQTREDNDLKPSQYSLSGARHPLDILGSKVLNLNASPDDIERLTMII